jgi:hypothetical protein
VLERSCVDDNFWSILLEKCGKQSAIANATEDRNALVAAAARSHLPIDGEECLLGNFE